MVPFKELGLGLSEEQISEEEAHNLTDGFSLPALKVIHSWKGRKGRRKARCVWVVPVLSDHKWCTSSLSLFTEYHYCNSFSDAVPLKVENITKTE